jgi:VWFA-related protein
VRGSFFVVLLLTAVFPAAAADQTQPQFSDSQDVVVVEVPVQVLRDGEPVRGLTAGDFDVYEGKRKLPVTGFEVLDLSQAPAGNGQAGQAGDTWKNPRAISARRHFLLLFDLAFSSPAGMEKAQTAAHDMLAGLHPSDLVAVAAYLPTAGPQLLLGFTTDRRQAAQALGLVGKPEMFDRVADPLRLVLDSGFIGGGSEGIGAPAKTSVTLGGGSGSGGSGEGGPGDKVADIKAGIKGAILGGEAPYVGGVGTHLEQADRAVQERAVTAMAQAFEDLAKTMGGLYGRKYVVFFSEGFDSAIFGGSTQVDEQLYMAAASNAGATWGIDSEKRFGNTKVANDLEAMLEQFRRADCVIQAVDIGGLREGAGPAAQWAGGKDSLFLMADGTGGELFENYNDLSAAMEQMLRRTSVTYVLALQPEGLARDGAYHEIRVDLKNSARGTRIVHRPGYYAPRPFGQQSPTEKLLQTARGVVGQDVGTIATSVLAAPFASGGREAYVPVVIEVDGKTLTAGTEGWSVPVEIYAYAFDAEGQARDFFSQILGLELLKVGAALQQSGLKFFGHLDLPPGTWNVRVLVRNAASGAAGMKSVTVQVPELGEAVLLPAFFPEEAGKWLTVREAQPGEPVPYPFMAGGQPYIPASLPTLEPGGEARVSLVGYHLLEGDLRAEAKILNADGQEAGAGQIRVLERHGRGADGADRVTAAFQAPRLAPGEYLLRVTLTGPDGRPESAESSITPFRVRGF